MSNTPDNTPSPNIPTGILQCSPGLRKALERYGGTADCSASVLSEAVDKLVAAEGTATFDKNNPADCLLALSAGKQL